MDDGREEEKGIIVMMQLTAAMIGMLGGPALQVLMVLAIENGQRSLSFLQDMTNLSDKTLHQATRKLVTMGFIHEQTINREKVFRIANIEQLPLGAVLPEPTEETTEEPEDETSFGNFPKDVLNESMNESDSNDIDDSFIDSCDGRKNSESPETVTAAELRGFGFYGRGIGEILKIQGLTLREIRYHVQNAPSLGAALARIKKRQPVPGGWESDRTALEDRRKYVEGAFSEFIEH